MFIISFIVTGLLILLSFGFIWKNKTKREETGSVKYVALAQDCRLLHVEISLELSKVKGFTQTAFRTCVRTLAGEKNLPVIVKRLRKYAQNLQQLVWEFRTQEEVFTFLQKPWIFKQISTSLVLIFWSKWTRKRNVTHYIRTRLSEVHFTSLMK